MFRDLFIGSFLGLVIALWQTQRHSTRRTLDSADPADPSEPNLLRQQLAQTQKELALALERHTQAQTQIAELNQLATDRAIELIQLQSDNAELLAQIATLSQKRTRKKRAPKEVTAPDLGNPEHSPIEAVGPVPAQNPISDALPEIMPEPTPAPAFALNLDLIQAKQVETTAANQLLQTVFVEESTLDQAQSTSHTPMIGLDTNYSTFLRTLAQQMQWRREDLAELAQQADLLLDGALEVINEAAFERCDEPLTDGDDPIELNPDVLQVLLS